MGKLFTIGYEGQSSDDFLRNLKRHGVSVLVDIREIPLSRKKGFSKSSLARTLENQGIEYVHIKRLGSPSVIRNRLKQDHNYDSFFEDFTKYLMSNALAELQSLYQLATKKNSCLMCFEKDYNYCHRSVVAKKLSRLNGTKLEVHHIS